MLKSWRAIAEVLNELDPEDDLREVDYSVEYCLWKEGCPALGEDEIVQVARHPLTPRYSQDATAAMKLLPAGWHLWIMVLPGGQTACAHVQSHFITSDEQRKLRRKGIRMHYCGNSHAMPTAQAIVYACALGYAALQEEQDAKATGGRKEWRTNHAWGARSAHKGLKRGRKAVSRKARG